MKYPVTAFGEQPSQPGVGLESNKGSLATVALGAGAIIAGGFISTSKGRLWDKYISVIRGVETGSPGAVLRTFRISEFLSPLESYTNINVHPETMRGGKYAEFLRASFGEASGLNLTRTGSIFGEVTDESGKLLGYGLQIKAGTQKGTAIADYAARISGLTLTEHQSLNESLLKAEYRRLKPAESFHEWLNMMEPELRRKRLILGSKLRSKINILGKDLALSQAMSRRVAKAETLGLLLRSKAASTAGRLNTLLTAPFELPIIQDITKRIPFFRTMAVKPGSNMQIMARLARKGIYAGLAWKGLEYADYLRSEDSPLAPIALTALGMGFGNILARRPGMKFSKAGLIVGGLFGAAAAVAPRFDEGLFYGAATIGTDASLARASFSQAAGLTESLQEQERITPGLTSPLTGLAFGGTGALAAGIYSYSGLIKKSILSKGANQTFASAVEIAREASRVAGLSALWESPIGQKIAKTPILKHITKLKSSGALGFVAGLAAWQGITSALSIISGNPLSAIPGAGLLGTTETPEELQAIYSGEKDVAIRKGRWWELGKCLMVSTTCRLIDGSDKQVNEIKVGDILIGRDYKPAKVLNIFTRNFIGCSFKFSSAFDRDAIIETTGNHIIPIIKKGSPKTIESVVEVSAEEIQVNDYVEIPVQKLDSNISEINTLDYIIEPVIVQDKKIYSSQKNWHTGKLQKSGSYNLPLTIPLNNDIGFLFGIYLAEGNIDLKNNVPHMIEMVHSIHEEWIVERIQKITEKYFNTKTTIRLKKTGKKVKEGCYITRICSSILAKLFKGLFYPKKYIALEKSIPNILKYGTKDFKEGLIDGYYSGDGHFNCTKIISSSRKRLLEQTQQIALSIDLLSGIGPKEENGFLGKWRLRFVAPENNNPSVIKINNRIFAAIRSIETDEYNGIVYDFEVDNPDHLFVAGSFLVHNSSYEGDKIQYYRPHFLPRLKARAYQKGLYGNEEEAWAHDPVLHPFKALFGDDDWKYWYEQKYQAERPAPLSSTYFSDVPFIGPLLAATVGKLFKPRKLIRPEEWIGEEGFVHHPDIRGEEEPAYHLGGLGPGGPVAPEESSQLLNELNYRRREAVGLVGFAEGAITKALIGREEFLPNKEVAASMGKETGYEYWLWKHLNLGGFAGSSEGVRRFIPRTPSYKEFYNPLRNQMPSWIPNDYFLDLKTGNPFSKIPEAEIRLPGTGYCLHPNTKIETDNGYIPIKDIKIEDKVLTSQGYQKVKKCFNRNYNGNLISIKSYGGLNEATVLTPEHKVKGIRIKKCKYHKSSKNKKRRPCKLSNFCYKMKCNDFEQNIIEWIQAKDLREGDYVLRPENKILNIDRYKIKIDKIIKNFNIDRIDQSTYQLYRPYRDKIIKSRQIKLELKDSNELWFIFGLYLAEGSLKKGGVSFAFHKNETYLFDFIKNLFPNAKTYLKEKNGIVVDINNKILRIIIESLFGRAKNKTIPKELNNDQFLALFSGLIQGDGCKTKEGLTLSISPIYNKLLNLLIYYCNIFNIKYSLTKRKTREEYTFKILASSTNELNLLDYKKIIFSKSKTISDFPIENYRAFKIKKIDIIKYNGSVYDIEVNNIHEYCTSFIVHNSALNPEVEGLSPEEYPLAHRVKILGDIAMYSDEYRKSLSFAKRNKDKLSDNELAMVLETERQVRERKKKRQFEEYRFNSGLLNQEEVTISEIISPSRFKTKEYGDLVVEAQGVGKIADKETAMSLASEYLQGQKVSIYTPSMESRKFSSIASGARIKAVPMVDGQTWNSLLQEQGAAQSNPLQDEFEQLEYSGNEQFAGKLSENILHGLETPLEYLTPMSPVSKLIHQRSAIEEYAVSEAHGSMNAFWDRPVENFIEPALNMTKYRAGDTDIPESIQQRRDLLEYYDMLKWVKSSRLESLARQEGDLSEAAEFKRQKQSTVFGMDVFGSPVNIMRALPRRERDFFGAFSAAKSEEDRQKILEMIPENEQRIYLAEWLKQEERTAYAKRKANLATEEDNNIINLASLARKGEGFSYSKQEQENWLQETGGRIEFDDYIREQKAEEYFATHSLPGADWLGWSPAVDLDDIKMVNAELSGMDFHDLDLWDQRKRSLAKKPYINPELIEEMQVKAEYQDAWKVAQNSKSLAKMYHDNQAEVQLKQMGTNTGKDKYNITIMDNREELIEKAYKELGL